MDAAETERTAPAEGKLSFSMRQMTPHEFVRRLRASVDEEDSRFAFFLGAGCSMSSGIPDASTLVGTRWLPRLKQLKTGSDENLDSWAAENFTEYVDGNLSPLYGEIIEDLFITAQARQQEIERLTEAKDPGFGYAVVARLISHERYGPHANIVLTTNFDDMVADALYLYTNKKPLVISHELLSGFVRVTRTRPLVLKLHGDARLAPRNTTLETQALAEELRRVLTNLLSETGLIFIGYGGNDPSITSILQQLPPSALPWGVYWVSDSMPGAETEEWLRERRGAWVRHRDFDELMLLVWNEFELGHPEKRRFDTIWNTYFETFKTLKKQVEAGADTAEGRVLERAADRAAREFGSWWSVQLEALKYWDSDPDKADKVYRAGLEEFPTSPELIGQYAVFLELHKKDDQADSYYERAIEADPTFAANLANYAAFLLSRGDPERGFDVLATAMKRAENEPTVLLYCSYYGYAHASDESRREEFLDRIRELIGSGVLGGPDWDVTATIQRARADGHPQPELLEKLAQVIASQADAEELKQYDAWKGPSQ